MSFILIVEIESIYIQINMNNNNRKNYKKIINLTIY